ncbi:fungal-specific transcription factor domain-containing protein [Aspergillus pseudoustus]|uniref:Fungal-specific transcription factor domain-containing protein n=1 Tax=Aspergillus pseudoustus TaxID=1810923 RepID=A0ABR4JXP8_9EURO
MSMSSITARRKSAFSCDQCRKRKVKCGGEQPGCIRCTRRNDTCEYKLNPTLSYTERLENRVKELEEYVSLTQGNGYAAPNGRTEQPPTMTALPAVLPRTLAKRTYSEAFKGLKVDPKGGVTYHGATSFFQLPTSTMDEAPGVQDGGPSHMLDEGNQRKEKLVSNAWHQRALESFLETPEPFQFLLNIHWCWIQPLFNFIYRPAFTRDMEVLGPYYSHTLLNAILSHSIRWCKQNKEMQKLLEPYENGALFSRQARSMIFSEVSSGHPKVPTVQTLLLLSAQESSAGNRTQAWMYSGMAFRLIEDMGITYTADGSTTGLHLEDEDVEIRQRLFWSCYFWDKMISLYLGRTPTLQHCGMDPDQMIMDDYAEHELWTPHGVVYPEGSEYPPTTAHSISCFRWTCRLAIIFNQILLHIYDPSKTHTESELRACLQSEGQSLKQWWDDLPDFLKIDTANLPEHCPPSHIVTLNCLYHVFKILLYRPMLTQRNSMHGNRPRAEPHHLVECISSAISIITIYDLFCSSFGYQYTVLSLSYSLYTALSIFLLQIQAAARPNAQALSRLRFCINALQRLSVLNPVVSSALTLVTDTLSKLGLEALINTVGEENATQQEVNANSFSTQDDYTAENQGHSDYCNLYTEEFEFTISDETLEAFQLLTPMEATFGIGYD